MFFLRRVSVRLARRCGRPISTFPSGFGDYSLILPANLALEGVAHIKPRPVPPHIVRPFYAILESEVQEKNGNNLDVKPPTEEAAAVDQSKKDSIIELGGRAESALRRSCQLAREVLEYAQGLVEVGVTTESIDLAIHEFIISHSAYPSPLLYSGYPKSCCTSVRPPLLPAREAFYVGGQVNNIIAHGIPDERPLEDGDIVNVDITVYLDGFHGDTSRTFLVGNVDVPGRELVEATTEALRLAVLACQPGKPFKSIGATIQEFAHQNGYSIATAFCGHGIGKIFHTPPWILHHANDEPGKMQPGHVFTIEPCLVQGSKPQAWMFPDGWAVSTETGARSAQAEHTVLITESGVDVLTE